jgi:glycosyltransferase involved in cell wall biosynthesis
MDLSLVIPLYNEEESLPELSTWIEGVINKMGLTYEIIFVDDGSNDNSWEVIEMLNHKNPNIKGVRFRKNYGKSAALNRGFFLSKGEVVITMDADLQDSPDEIPDLYKMINEKGFDIVSGWKKSVTTLLANAGHQNFSIGRYVEFQNFHYTILIADLKLIEKM